MDNSDKVELTFWLFGKGALAYRYTNIIPDTGDKIVFQTVDGEYTVLYKKFAYFEDKIKAYVFMEKE